jgi:hypothetical protein
MPVAGLHGKWGVNKTKSSVVLLLGVNWGSDWANGRREKVDAERPLVVPTTTRIYHDNTPSDVTCSQHLTCIS